MSSHVLISLSLFSQIRTLHPGFQSRIYSILSLIQTAIESAPQSYLQQLKPLDLVFVSADKDGFSSSSTSLLTTSGKSGAGWRVNEKLSDSGKGTWLMPDFAFASWPEAGIPSFHEFKRLSREVEDRVGWNGKDERVMWRGWADVHLPRQDLLDRTLRKEGKGTEMWSDVGETTFHGDKGNFKDLVSLIWLSF